LDFNQSASDFFARGFPSGSVKVELQTNSRNLAVGRKSFFTDEFKVSTVRDNATGAISAEVKNTSFFPILNSKISTILLLADIPLNF
jgi:hypothetical protein